MTDYNSDSEIEIIADKTDDITKHLNSYNNKIRNKILQQSRFNPDYKMNPQINSQSSAPLTNVGLPPVDKTELNLLLRAIPENESGNNLSIFITEVDNLVDHLKGRLSRDLIYVVEYTIRSKIIGEARNFIAYQNVNDWSNIKIALLRRPQKNFTNKQVFGNPKPIIPQSQYKPTPMSGISTFTNNKIKPPQNFDQSSSNPRRNFISEELNNVEPEQLEVVQDELEEIYQGDHIQDDYDQKEDENFWEPASNFPTTI
ncbi:hypothetical protein FQA39_LY09629 [Lamprigera yunnana]|nr:hypothetical protein FQA39_LY09629 [Lamprigera yunnana]